MGSFRSLFSWSNEFGLVLSGLLTIGYFGGRGLLGWLPTLFAIGLIIGAIVVAWSMTKPMQQQEEGGFQEQPENRDFSNFLLLLGFFICGFAVFVYFGSLL